MSPLDLLMVEQGNHVLRQLLAIRLHGARLLTRPVTARIWCEHSIAGLGQYVVHDRPLLAIAGHPVQDDDGLALAHV